jgi:hypothetical protein
MRISMVRSLSRPLFWLLKFCMDRDCPSRLLSVPSICHVLSLELRLLAAKLLVELGYLFCVVSIFVAEAVRARGEYAAGLDIRGKLGVYGVRHPRCR